MKKIDIILDALEDVNAKDIEIYDMREKSPFFDFLIISSATSNRQLKASISHVTDDLAKAGYDVPRVEGKNSNAWVLLDCKDIIVNVFTQEERAYYNLEKMLAEIETVKREQL